VHRQLALLGKRLEFAAQESLPPIAWTVQSAGASLTGQVLSRRTRGGATPQGCASS
jgi:hypothetical protein